jgi:HD superfamily phosphodiesterase
MPDPSRCVLCGWLLNDEHAFNVHCAAANAENDQLEAEIRELQQEPLDAEGERLQERVLKYMREALERVRAERDDPLP